LQQNLQSAHPQSCFSYLVFAGVEIADEQTGAPAFGYPAKDQRELAAKRRRLMSMLVADKTGVTGH